MTKLEQILKQSGLKVTAPRLKILEIFESSQPQHISAEDLYKQLLDEEYSLGLATIYRVLNQFDEAGIITRHNFEGGTAIFERSERKHDHIICQRCGDIIEFDDPVINERLHEIAKRYHMEVGGKELCLYGICEKHGE